MGREILMEDVNSKLANARNACPGLSEHVYALTDYMSVYANKCLTPQGLLLCFVICLDDIKSGKRGIPESVEPFPEYLLSHKVQVLVQAAYVPQVIDALADEDFSTEFRSLCKKILNFNPPKRQKIDDTNTHFEDIYPKNVQVAVNWWANAIANPKFDNGDKSASGGMASILAMMLSARNTITEEQVKKFKKELAELIVEQLDDSAYTCNLSVDYGPNHILSAAAEKADIPAGMNFPRKTQMTISKDKVTVREGDGASTKILWQIQ